MCPIALSSRWRAAAALPLTSRQPQRLPFLFVKMGQWKIAVDSRVKVAGISPMISATIDYKGLFPAKVAVNCRKVAEWWP
jgi:hypothetical protein